MGMSKIIYWNSTVISSEGDKIVVQANNSAWTALNAGNFVKYSKSFHITLLRIGMLLYLHGIKESSIFDQ